tara:strand:+ start:588 stop:1598 length:1011 start_codon:yes stop_codon:yes gene_type:complete
MELHMIHTFGKIHDPRNQEVKDQKILQSYLNFLNEGYKSFGLNVKQKTSLVKETSHYAFKGKDLSIEDSDYIRMFINHGKHHVNHGLDSISNCCHAVREFRKDRKYKSAIYSNKQDGKKVFRKERVYDYGFFNGQTVNSKYSFLTEQFARKWWSDNQARTNVKIKADALRSETSIEPSPIGRNDNWNYHDSYNEISLSPSWFKNVFMKGLATTVYKSRTAFVVSAKPLQVADRITANGLIAYTIDLITCHDGIVDIEKDLYYLVYESKPLSITTAHDDFGGNIPYRGHNAEEKAKVQNNIIYTPAETINCASSNFRRAENVMNGRVQKNLLDAMGV